MDSYSDDELLYRIAMSMMKGMTVPLVKNLLDLVGTERDFFSMSDRTLRACLQLPDMRSLAAGIRREALERAHRERDFVYAHSVECLYFSDEGYPQRLLQCPDAPVMLYKLGSADLNPSRIAAVVGTRHSTVYGLDFTGRIIKDFRDRLAEKVTIVSGLAYGIDIAAHQAAQKEGLPTVAVVAHGVDTIYPSQHRGIAAKMVGNDGAIVTEYPSGTVIHRGNFLARNRIVAGMSDCVVVVESARKGGALITARLAGDYDREVFALPGRVSDKYSEGCNELIAENRACLTDGADRIIDHMGWERKAEEGVQRELFPSYSPEEEAVIAFLRQNDNVTTNNLSVAVGLPMGRLLSLLIEMEFKGIVVKLPGARYRLR